MEKPRIKKSHGKLQINRKRKTKKLLPPQCRELQLHHRRCSFCIHEPIVGRKRTTLCLQLKRRQDPAKHFTLLQRRAPRDILPLVFLIKSKLVFTALLTIPLFRHVPWALGEGLDRDAPPYTGRSQLLHWATAMSSFLARLGSYTKLWV